LLPLLLLLLPPLLPLVWPHAQQRLVLLPLLLLECQPPSLPAVPLHAVLQSPAHHRGWLWAEQTGEHACWHGAVDPCCQLLVSVMSYDGE
jgi:hypothetical protein